ncbi:6318_t:CDS:2 [Diversispora eburnea]|uniref:6318_t:CDS:1 n=1 Tax=Diversispora eburnea TaxID=1213867 RepID=A0A9N9BCZ3_9GLOM|nr:6318_t:CDS:2 [Diversispora eburnea]
MQSFTQKFRQFQQQSRHTIYRAQHNETSADIEKPEKRLTPIIRNPIGAFRGGLIGFLLGLTIAGGSGYYYLLDEYHTASNLLLSSVEELQKSTSKVRDYAQKIERLEGELKSLQGSAATTDQIKELRSETRKLFDGLNLQHLELKTNVWNISEYMKKLN